jgi:hypothetical protein
LDDLGDPNMRMYADTSADVPEHVLLRFGHRRRSGVLYSIAKAQKPWVRVENFGFDMKIGQQQCRQLTN